jgi:hypothetical protein
MTHDLKMVQCFTEPLYNNLQTELVWKQKHNTVTMMFSSYKYISTAIFLIKKKKKERKKRKEKDKKSAIDPCCHCVAVQPITMSSPFQHFL